MSCARAERAAETDWPRIAALYDELAQLAPSPVVELNRAVAVAMADGPAAGLDSSIALRGRARARGYHLLPSVRGDLLFKLGRHGEARVRSSARRRSRPTAASATLCSSAPGKPWLRNDTAGSSHLAIIGAIKPTADLINRPSGARRHCRQRPRAPR